MERAYNFAKENRALGLGNFRMAFVIAIKNVALQHPKAYNLNSKLFKEIKERSYKASEELAEKFGET